MHDDSLQLMTPAPESRLLAWLEEFYGRSVRPEQRQLLRHRDLSYVERLSIDDGFPRTLIYKLVLPPWDIEHDLQERVLVPSVANSPQMYFSSHWGNVTAMFFEDLGSRSLQQGASADIAARVGKELAKTHRSYCYRTDELLQSGALRALNPIDYEDFAAGLGRELVAWQVIDREASGLLTRLAGTIAPLLAREPISLVHGDFYAENVILQGERLYFIDWSWFSHVGVPLVDLATLTMDHFKNTGFHDRKQEVIEAYCFESGRQVADVMELLPPAETLSRLYFLHWLVERRSRGIMGTTVGPVDALMLQVVAELSTRLEQLER